MMVAGHYGVDDYVKTWVISCYRTENLQNPLPYDIHRTNCIMTFIGIDTVQLYPNRH